MVVKLQVAETNLKGVLVITPLVHRDERGYFFDSYVQPELQKYGLPDFVQQSQSFSRQGVVRGPHFQRPPYAQAKLVRVLQGAILDIVVDIQKDSPTYGQHSTIKLSAANFKQLFIPEGFAHGFSVLSKTATVLYNLSKVYNPEAEGGIYPIDKDLAINWGVPTMLISEKDKKWPLFSHLGDVF